MNLSSEEMALVKGAQADLATAKAALRYIAQKMRAMAAINRKAGRAHAANAAMRLEGAATRLRGDLIEAHATASDALCDCFDDGGVVVFGGGGGR
jgi:hypothetical protein